MTTQNSGAPRATLSVTDGALMMVGIVIGIGIFKTPQLVASSCPNESAFIAALGCWAALTTLIGALVYAELAAAYPSTGGEYHFLTARLWPAGRVAVRLGAQHRDPDRRDRRGRLRVRRLRAGRFCSLGPYRVGHLCRGRRCSLLTLVNLAGTYREQDRAERSDAS